MRLLSPETIQKSYYKLFSFKMQLQISKSAEDESYNKAIVRLCNAKQGANELTRWPAEYQLVSPSDALLASALAP